MDRGEIESNLVVVEIFGVMIIFASLMFGAGLFGSTIGLEIWPLWVLEIWDILFTFSGMEFLVITLFLTGFYSPILVFIALLLLLFNDWRSSEKEWIVWSVYYRIVFVVGFIPAALYFPGSFETLFWPLLMMFRLQNFPYFPLVIFALFLLSLFYIPILRYASNRIDFSELKYKIQKYRQNSYKTSSYDKGSKKLTWFNPGYNESSEGLRGKSMDLKLRRSFHCQIDQELHPDTHSAYQCNQCGRIICSDCLESRKKAGATNYHYCKEGSYSQIQQ